jgi:hypothetical protein
LKESEVDNLAALWLEAKQAENEWTERRRAIEDQMLATDRTEWAGYKVRVTSRDNWKVDGDKLQEVAAAHNLTDHLGRLFRWKPEINMALWKASEPTITKPLLEAITITPGRASFAITKED